ncbi:Solute carrier family 25 member 38 [Blattella germanica]|nr:Solute carrier family 25 member 38 [Blattella germanica]
MLDTVSEEDINHLNSKMDMISNYPVLKSFLVGSFSGTFSTIIFQPLDLVKTRLQNPSPKCFGVRPGEPCGMMTIIGHILQKEHVFGLWRGMTPSITRCVPGVGLYFSSLHWLKTNVTNGEPGPFEAIALGMLARSMSGVCLIPITVIKTRYESGVYQYGGVTEALRVIYRTEGVRGLCCGLVPTLFRDAPFSGLYFMFYTQTKRSIPKEWYNNSNFAAPLNFSCGIVAGLFASIVTQPADVIKTKMQLYPEKFNGIQSVIVYIHQKYGMKGYFKGLVPRMLRRTLMAAMAWTVYEQVTRSIGLK